MSQIDVTYVDTGVRRIDRDDATWFITGVDPEVPVDDLVAGDDASGFCGANGDALVVRIRTGADLAVTVWKGLYSTRELFWSLRPNGDVVLADHYRNVMAMLPVAERATSDTTEAAHHLSRKPYGPLTMAASTFRAPFGARLDIDPAAGTTDSHVFARVPREAEERPSEEYVADIERSLRSVIDGTDPADTGVMFSGGVDSTLLLAFDPDAMQPITFVPDTPEFGIETDYAHTAAQALGVTTTELPVPEATFVERLEAVTDASGIPSFSDAGPYYHEVFARGEPSTIVEGHGADNSFGSNLRIVRFSNAFSWSPSRQVLARLAPIAPGHLGYRIGQVSGKANGLAADPGDPDGFAGDSRTYGDEELLGRIYGDIPRRLKEQQLAYTIERLERPGEGLSRFLAHLELHHWMLVFGGAMYQNQMNAAALGKRAIGPYCDWRVLAAANRIPMEDRWIVGLQSKWILKQLLGRLAPEYPINQRKKATAFPWRRFYADGPLTGFFERYPVPEAFTGTDRQTVLDGTNPATWTSITLAVWKERIARNPDLEPVAVHTQATFKPEPS